MLRAFSAYMRTANRVTDRVSIKESKVNVNDFHWGRVISVHSIGRYEIVEYAQLAVEGVTVTQRETGMSEFHSYVDGLDTHHSFATLEEAIVGAIAYVHEGANHRANIYFFRMLHE
jgi:hypothetical protein